MLGERMGPRRLPLLSAFDHAPEVASNLPAVTQESAAERTQVPGSRCPRRLGAGVATPQPGGRQT